MGEVGKQENNSLAISAPAAICRDHRSQRFLGLDSQINFIAQLQSWAVLSPPSGCSRRGRFYFGARLDSDKIIKLLQLSQSPNDHEALSAIRKANELVISGCGHWNRFFIKEKPTYTRPPSPEPKEKFYGKEAEMIDAWCYLSPMEQQEAIDLACKKARDTFRSMIYGIKQNWLKRGKLTEKQILCIMRSVEFN